MGRLSSHVLATRITCVLRLQKLDLVSDGLVLVANIGKVVMLLGS